MQARPRETGRLIHNLNALNALNALNTIGGSPMVFVVREVWHPPTDVYETGDAYVVCVEIAGMSLDDLRVAIEDDELTVCGRRDSTIAGYNAVHRLEMHYGDFETAVLVPGPVQEDAIEADYRKGILVVTLPKASPRRIVVEAI
jgi:HSP20 family protein